MHMTNQKRLVHPLGIKMIVFIILLFFIISPACASTLEENHSGKKQRIAIVGAGPAGLSFASRIQEAFNGSVAVTIFDSRSNIGGQSRTTNITGTPIDKTTRYLIQSRPVSTIYDEVFHLFRQNGIETYDIPSANVLKSSGNGRGLVPANEPLDAVFRAAYAALAVTLATYQTKNPGYTFRGNYSSSFDAGDNLALNDFFDVAVEGQLYGPRNSISAHSLLTWLAGFVYYGSQERLVSMVTGGWQPAWEKIAENSGSQIMYNSHVMAVNPNLTSGNPEVILKDGNQFVFDAVVVTPPLDEISMPLSLHETGSPKFDDTYVSTIAFGSSSMANEALPERYYIRDMHDLGCPVSSIQYNGFSSTLKMEIWSVSMYEPGKDATEEESRARARPWIDSMMLTIDTAYNKSETHFVDGFWELYRYNVRFSPEQFDLNLPQKIDAVQGTNNIWYGGGALSHWNVGDIVHQSSMIVERMASQYGMQPSWKFIPAMKKKTNRKITEALIGAKVNLTISDLLGHYKLDDHMFADGIEIERVDDEEDIISTLPMHAIAATKGAPIVAVGKISLRSIHFFNDPNQISGFSMLDQNKDGYYVALHANGVVRFHSINPSPSVRDTLLIFDSKNMTDAGLNGGHAIKYGWFCFGVMKENSSGVITIQRYNRWAEDVDMFYLMEKINEKSTTFWILVGLVFPVCLGLLTFGMIQYLQTKKDTPPKENPQLNRPVRMAESLIENKVQFALFNLIMPMIFTVVTTFSLVGFINWAVRPPDWSHDEHENSVQEPYPKGGSSVTGTSPQTLLTDAGFQVYLGFIVWITVVIAGLGLEAFVWHHFLEGNVWDDTRAGLWKVAQFLFPLLAMTTLGLAVSHSYLALPILVPALWKFGFPETLIHLYLGILNKRAHRFDRASDICNGIGTLLHHSAASFIISMLVVGVVPPSRLLLNQILILVMQHWASLLKYVSIPVYSTIELVLEYYFEWTVLSDWAQLYRIHWAAALGACVMLFAHWLYLLASIFAMLAPGSDNEAETFEKAFDKHPDAVDKKDEWQEQGQVDIDRAQRVPRGAIQRRFSESISGFTTTVEEFDAETTDQGSTMNRMERRNSTISQRLLLSLIAADEKDI